MSYWNEHQKQPGQSDLRELDWQVEMVSRVGGEISLCLGARQVGGPNTGQIGPGKPSRKP